MIVALDIDAGNTRIKWRLRENEVVTRRGDVLCEDFSAEQFAAQMGMVPDQVNLCSVAQPAIIESFRNLCRRWDSNLFEAQTCPHQAGVTCGYTNHHALGVDRWMAILAAFHRAKGASTVVDAGSAITIDMVAGNGMHLGGYIVPGYRMLCQALSGGTAQVRPEDPTGVSLQPGRSTAEAVNHGIMGMIKGLVDGVISAPGRREESINLYLTGGDAPLLANLLGPAWEVIPDLVLDGLTLASREFRMGNYG